MCGICGIVNFDGRPVSELLLKEMTSSLAHRGPDGEGVYIRGGIGLGHRRLSVIDLSTLASQPMTNEDGTVWITFNGEIYNFFELREELEAKGHRFRSRSDTETILHLYEEYGPDCVHRLNGMFAFAIWNEMNRSLFIARDRLGKKPLYYRHAGDYFIFSSEIRAILCERSFVRRPDLTAIHHYLTFQSVPSPWTAFENILKLPPAHYLVLKDSRIEIKRYWQLSYLPKHSLDEKRIAAKLVSGLRKAVRARMVSDVPLGAFLSGGIDSAAVVALMTEVSDRPVRTFSIGFREEPYNELAYAKIVAKRFATEHTEFVVDPRAADLIERLVRQYGEPFADASAIPSWYVSQLAREHVTVVLSGDGGDESFAGYERYAANRVSDVLTSLMPKSAISALFKLSRRIPHGQDSMSLMWKIKRLFQEAHYDNETRNARWLSHFTPEQKQAIYSKEFSEHISGQDSYALIRERYREAIADSFLERALHADVSMYLSDTLLVKTDIVSMAHSLEVRSPFLDYEFMEFSAKIPPELKLKGLTSKYILKRAMRGILPDEIISRRKRGFAVPLEYWFRKELKQMAYEVILSERALSRGYFKREPLKKVLDEHVSGARNSQYHIWSLLMLELWHRMFIDSSGRKQ